MAIISEVGQAICNEQETLEYMLTRFKTQEPLRISPVKDLSRVPVWQSHLGLLAYVRKAIGEQELTPEQEAICKRLADWAVMGGESGYDYNKGVLLKGATGTGKTTILTAFSKWLRAEFWTKDYDEILGKHLMVRICTIKGENNSRKPFNLIICSTRDIVRAYNLDGYEGVKQYETELMLCIDDLGAESSLSAHFGNRVDVVEEVLYNREAKHLITFATTNLNKLSDCYDQRVVSRCMSLFNVDGIQSKEDFRRGYKYTK